MSNREIPRMKLYDALCLLAEVHTYDEPTLGFIVQMGATPDFPYHRNKYVEAWEVVRRNIGMQTDPSQ